jgi:hypothetical protein
MGATPTDLFRTGNSRSAQLDRIRVPKDVTTFQNNGIEWVACGSGGASTFDLKRSWPGSWWKLPAGTNYDELVLVLRKDHGRHWLFEPVCDMPLTDYLAALRAVNANFIPA